MTRRCPALVVLALVGAGAGCAEGAGDGAPGGLESTAVQGVIYNGATNQFAGRSCTNL